LNLLNPHLAKVDVIGIGCARESNATSLRLNNANTLRDVRLEIRST
jgi:hypothetical protein